MADSRTVPETDHLNESSAFLRVFDALRLRPTRSDARLMGRMERRAARRLRVGNRGGVQRGDVAEPPPVLDLELEEGADREKLLNVLTERCGDQPVWRLPLRSSGGPEPEEWPRAHEAYATTEELYDLVSGLLAEADAAKAAKESGKEPAEESAEKRGWMPPPWPRFARLRSLLWLRVCRLGTIRSEASGEEVSQDGADLEASLRAQIHVGAALRRAKLEHGGGAEREDDRATKGRYPRPGLRGFYDRAFHWVAVKVAGLPEHVDFDKANNRVAAPVDFWVKFLSALLLVATALWGTAAVANTMLQSINNLVIVGIGLVLAVVYTCLFLFVVLPWHPYHWLNHHRYVVDTQAARDSKQPVARNHRERGVHVLNLLNRQHLTGRLVRDPGADDAEHPRVERPPGIHRLVVNAFLDDLAHTHGGAPGRRPFPLRRGRHQRPVLLVDQYRLDRVGRYLVRLIEDERLRRGFPDPLLVVQVRAHGTRPLVNDGVDASRYPKLPESENGRRPHDAVSRWLRERHASGVLGRSRLLTQRIPVAPSDWDSPHAPEPVTVRTAALITRNIAAVTAGLTAAAVLAVWLGGPAMAEGYNSCGSGWVVTPPGVERHGEDCVGVTFGAFVFHERLREVTERIHEQNEQVDEDDGNHVTLAYVAQLSATGNSDLSLSGVQGELLGLAHQQAEHNASGDGSLPRIKILITNTGENWRYARETAEMIVERAQDEGRGMDRPVAALGFGDSVQPNTEAVRVLSGARIPMISTTATFDDVAMETSGKYSQYFFPVAPSNTRMAEQAALWAYRGVPWTGNELVEGQEPPSLGPARTAVAIANNQQGESYGPHLAVRFMSAFRALGGQPWEGDGEPRPITLANGGTGTFPGVLPYQDGGLSQADQLARVCAEDPPDVIYFAGRSTDFMDFHNQLQEEGMCVEAGADIIGGDDIAKFVTDHAETLGHASGYPVFYTPLAASGAWSQYTRSSERAFYAEADLLIQELYGGEEGDEETEEEREQGTEAEAVAADGGMPSIAHAAVAHDAFRVFSRALRGIPRSLPEDTGTQTASAAPTERPSPFLGTDAGYEQEQQGLVENIQGTHNLSAVSGYLGFGEPSEGNWYRDRMVQLVVVGPLGSDGERQHVIAACGQVSTGTVDPGPACA
ncbi:ABC transporter substrate-binding protein [Nocardiopsis sp. HUAS JQ3]|uniref:ABC transporter substrate-binding protein n=1 Tax=Nocardiopsis sp. HUAS JQ3 TaxID=3061629 RepID=UPI0023A9E4AF|nr:ABC transporter substrate-binding protein [Nocardiopsis sp. HUAS JQ3]WDZ90232.1 ABC transporter substrate-binding protein [Nocardiopsis sp. HUAS JQ3]